MMRHPEEHRTESIAWLRAAVLGANDGLISTSSLIVGVAAAQQSRAAIILAGCAGVAAGALSMAAGEFVSVSSQADTERADLQRERRELRDSPQQEHSELAAIYVARGLGPELAQQVATQLMAHDALGSHARDELGLSEMSRARPLQAALASAAAFTVGAMPPVALAWFLPTTSLGIVVAACSLVLLAILGAVAAHLGRAALLRGAARVAFWGAVAMGVTALIGQLFDTAIS